MNFFAKFFKEDLHSNIANTLYERGLSIKDGKIYATDVEVQYQKIADLLEIDRRTVKETITEIESSEELNQIFKNIRSVPLLREHTKDWCLLQIPSTDAEKSGIISQITQIVANHGISIIQIHADNFNYSSQPTLSIVLSVNHPTVTSSIIEDLQKKLNIKHSIIL
jgi:predicted regulator of amino acid metabolism with ACT domain